ncbi:MAG: glycosyltransferase [Betaproteobacteria bacterium]|nr:glycosyltransferase [Betaproteobacteria bacterium]
MVVDDGSSDRTPALIAALAERHSCIRPFFRTNHGLPASRNYSFAQARGEWIAIIDQDDLCYPTRLERQLAVAQENPSARLVFCDVHFIDENDRVMDRHMAKFHLPRTLIPRGLAGNLLLELGCYVDSEAFFMHRESALALGAMDESLRYACDYEYFIRAGLSVDFAYTPEILAAWRIHASQATATFPRIRNQVRVVYRRFFWNRHVQWRTRLVLVKNLLRSHVGQVLDMLRR